MTDTGNSTPHNWPLLVAEFITSDSLLLSQKALDWGSAATLNTALSALRGSSMISASQTRSGLYSLDGRSDEGCPIWYHPGPQLSFSAAIHGNVASVDAGATDDSHLRTIGHYASPVVVTALSLAKRLKLGGDDLLAAVAVGYEVASRLADAIYSPAPNPVHPVALVGFATAAATARLIGLSAKQALASLSIAAGGAFGIKGFSWSHARGYLAGLAARNGVEAAFQANAGVDGSTEALTGQLGFLSRFAPGTRGIDVRDLGTHWAIAESMCLKIKEGPFPFAGAVQAVSLASMDMGVYSISDISAIEVASSALIELPPESTPPLTPEQCLLSFKKNVVRAVGTRPDEWTPLWSRQQNETTAHPVRIERSPRDFDSPYPYAAAATLHTRDGTSSSSDVRVPAGCGGLANDPPWAALEAKAIGIAEISGRTRIWAEDLVLATRQLAKRQSTYGLLEVLST